MTAPAQPPGPFRYFLRLAFLLILPGLFAVNFAGAQDQVRAGNTNVLAAFQGTVEIIRANGARSAARTNQPLASGERVLTGERSRATVYLADGQTIQQSEFSELEIPPSPGVNFKVGLFHVLNRDPRKNFWFNLRHALAGIRGTDFRVRVNDQQTELLVLDGAVRLSNSVNWIDLGPRELGTVQNNGQLAKTPVVEAVNNLLQWFLYYPGVLNVDELKLPAAERTALADSLAAYRRGDLRAAAQTFPWIAPPTSDDARAYRASLLLNAGQVDQARALIEGNAAPAARALRRLIAAVKFQASEEIAPPVSSSEWLAESYYQQSLGGLEAAHTAAGEATNRAPAFGFALARVAELEFGFGRLPAARAALDRSLEISPANAQAVALRGFLLAAENKILAAQAEFECAIALDDGLGNARLGRGLTLFRRGRTTEALRDLHLAAALEPQRALFRSYLGKAFAEQGDRAHAHSELALARQLDPNDPTGWLYSALLLQQSNHINEAVADLERSRALNDNRALHRSRLLLDQDRAVRSANLAAVYRDAGLFDVGLREASRAVVNDYANYSAHLFLANSYAELTDPNLVTLRNETAAFSEYLLANLLAPVGASTLSRAISQQEYGKLFERDRFGISARTFYSSQGDWQMEGSQFGTFGNTAYAVDGIYRSFNGTRHNHDLEQNVLSAQFKQQLTPQDAIYFQAIRDESKSGDLAQYYDHYGSTPSQSLRVESEQEPNAFLGYHREWSPGVHTLFLAARLEGRLDVHSADNPVLAVAQTASGQVIGTSHRAPDVFTNRYAAELVIYSAELQQIWQTERHIFIAGGRWQSGDFDGQTRLDFQRGMRGFTYAKPAARQKVDGDFDRLTAYAYHHWRVLEPLWLVAGVTLDQLAYPENAFASPISGEREEEEQAAPKAGFIWTPDDQTSVRGAYTRSLGGFSSDQSVRLEPTQVAGFNQAFRSLFPESVAGTVPGAEFETVNVGLDRRFATRTYAVFEAAWQRARGHAAQGIFEYEDRFGAPPANPAQLRRKLQYEEQSVAVALHQLIGDGGSVGARYRVSRAELETRWPNFPGVRSLLVPPDTTRRALLHQLNLFAIYNHSSGFFTAAEAVWWTQRNRADDSALSDEDLWQFNVFAGYRFPRRRAEIRLGLLNLTDEDYRLNPLSAHAELARRRTLTVDCKFNF